MEDRGSKPRISVTLCLLQMLLISTMAQEPAPAPDAAPAPPDVAPSTSPPVPPPVATPPPVEPPIPVQGFVTNTSFVLTAGNGSFTGRQSIVALTSPSGEYEFALVMDGFGTETDVHYCWTEVHNSLGNLTFRENCSPRKVEKCTLSLTERGDLRLTLESRGAKLVAWRSDTGDRGVENVKLNDDGLVTLVKADDSVVWKSSDDKDMCLEPYDPANGHSGSFGVSKLLIICTTALSLAISSCFSL